MSLTPAGKLLALAGVLPEGTNRWLALFSTTPLADGTGGVEVTATGYARVAISAWTNGAVAGITQRRNTATKAFPELAAAVTVTGWGIYDAATSGNLLAFDYTRNGSGVVTAYALVSGDVPEFVAQDLRVGLR